MKIKNATTDKVCQTEQIGKDEITVATGGTVRPAEPAEAVDEVYCIYYDDGEMTISQNEIEPEAGRTVVEKGFYITSATCTHQMTTVRFIGAVKPKNCEYWFYHCPNLTEIKNIQNLYTDNCTSMYNLFSNCSKLTSLDLSNFDTSNVTNMSSMFIECSSLRSLTFGNNFDTSNVIYMSYLFYNCTSLTTLDLSGFNTTSCKSMQNMFNLYKSNKLKKITVSLTFMEKLNELKGSDTYSFYFGTNESIFNIIDK